MPDGIMNAISGRLRICEGFIADEEIKVFNPTLGCQMPRLSRNGRCSRGLRRGATSRNRSRKHTTLGVNIGNKVAVSHLGESNLQRWVRVTCEARRAVRPGSGLITFNLPDLRESSTVITYNGGETSHAQWKTKRALESLSCTNCLARTPNINVGIATDSNGSQVHSKCVCMFHFLCGSRRYRICM